MKKLGLGLFFLSTLIGMAFSLPGNNLQFIGRIQCLNPKTKKLDAEYIILNNNISVNLGKYSLATLLKRYNEHYWITQTFVGNCTLQDSLNVYIKQPIDALELLNILIRIFNFKYAINGNLEYKTSVLVLNEEKLTLQDLLNLLIDKYIKASNPNLNIFYDIKARKIFIGLKPVEGNEQNGSNCTAFLKDYVDIKKRKSYVRYQLNIINDNIKLKPFIPCEGEFRRKKYIVPYKCSNSEPIGRIYIDSVSIENLLKLFEKLFNINFVYNPEELSNINSKKLHLYLECFNKQKALNFLKRNFHFYLERIADDTYRIFTSRDSYTLLLSQTSNYITKILYLKGISASEFIRKLEIKYGNKVVYTADPLFNAVTITAPQSIIEQILKDYAFLIRRSNYTDRLLTKIFYVKFGQPNEILNKIKNYLSKNGFAQYLSDANAIEVTDYPTNLSIIEKVFGKFLSQRPIKIKVTAKFVRINKTFARSLGINWDFTYGSNSVAKSIASWQVTQNQGSLTSQVQFLYKKFNPINLTIGAGESIGLSRVLSSPSLVLLPNQSGNISFGTQIPYQSVDQNGNPKTELVAATLTLNVTPQLLPDGRILLKLNLSNNSPNTALAVNGQPAIDTFTITQNFIVANGDTIIIGGVLQKKKEEGESGVPILREIPLLGWLFKNKNWTNTDNELYIVISAQIVTQ